MGRLCVWVLVSSVGTGGCEQSDGSVVKLKGRRWMEESQDRVLCVAV